MKQLNLDLRGGGTMNPRELEQFVKNIGESIKDFVMEQIVDAGEEAYDRGFMDGAEQAKKEYD